MTIVVGYAVDQGGRAALDLGLQFARSAGDSLLAATIVPAPWPIPSMARIDGEFAAWAAEEGTRQTAEARRHLASAAGDVRFDVVSEAGKSVPGALAAVVQDRAADLLVIGSADDGRHGRISVGSTASWLLHSSPVPVALAPRGYRPAAGSTIGRVTCAYAATSTAAAVLRLAGAFAVRTGAALRIATFGIRGRTMYPPETGVHMEDDVLAAWRAQAVAAQQEALSGLGEEHLLPPGAVTEVGAGPNWSEALEDLEWRADEVMLIGSSSMAPLARVFLGSRATKILRHSPVPVVVVPSVAAAEEAVGRLAG